jgi:hypothetical protein
MAKLQNSDLLRGILKALYVTAGRRTTSSFAIAVLGAIIRTLEQKYVFLNHIILHAEGGSEDFVIISNKVNSVKPIKIAKAIENIVQIVYLDLKEKAGLYFIKELMRNAGENVISNLKEIGVDLELIQIQQHYLYRRQSRGPKSKIKSQEQLDNVSLLGYSWENVSNWKFDTNKKTCVIYGRDGRELDRLNLDNIVKNYISSLSADYASKLTDDNLKEIKKIVLTDKEFEVLNMILNQDTDFESASALLHISQAELENMIKKFLTLELLHYISSDEVALTEIGIEYLKERKKAVQTV